MTTLATALGNTEAGDGRLFKGRGPIQITGRANYRRFGDLLGVDLVASPERAAQPDLAFRIAGLYWSKKGLNELADQATPEAFREITRRINGGFNGLADRQQFYDTARTVLGVSAPAVSREARPAAPPPSAPEPSFERGYEAVLAEAPPAAPRKRARVTSAGKPIVRKRARKAAGTSKRPRKTSSVKRGRRAPARARRTPVRRVAAVARRGGRKKPKR